MSQLAYNQPWDQRWYGSRDASGSDSMRSGRQERSHSPGLYSSPRLGIVHPLSENEAEKNLMEPLLIDTGSVHSNDFRNRAKGFPENRMNSLQQRTANNPSPQIQGHNGRPASGYYQGQTGTGDEFRNSGNAYTYPASRAIDPIKEDPDMGDDEILTSKKLSDLRKHLANQRMRLSISANDLIGKSHEELILLLIQLRRSQAKMENLGKVLTARLDLVKATVSSSSQVGQQFGNYFEEGEYCKELQQQRDEVNKQLDVIKPLVHLLHNMVTMGSIYGGDNLMLASQYKQYKLRPGEYTPPRKMIEFARNHQEEQLHQELQEEMKTLSKEEIDLEKKLAKLYELDRLLQETSMSVSSLQEDKVLLEKALESCTSQEGIELDPNERKKLREQRTAIEAQLSNVRQQLVETSRNLEATATENAKTEHEFILLRTQIYGGNQSRTVANENEDSLKVRMKIEKELNSIQSVMDGLSQQREKLSEVMDSIHPKTALVNDDITMRGYVETDLDTYYSKDIGLTQTQRAPASQKVFDGSHSVSGTPQNISKKNPQTDEGYSLNSYGSIYDDNLRGEQINNQQFTSDIRSRSDAPPASHLAGPKTEYIGKPTFAVQPLRQSGPVDPPGVQERPSSGVIYPDQNDTYSRPTQLHPTSSLPALESVPKSSVMSNSLTRWKGLNSVVEDNTSQSNQSTNRGRNVYQYPTDQTQTPTYHSDQRQTPTYHSDQRQTPTYHSDQRQTPTYPTDQRQMPTYHSDPRQTPTYHSDPRQTPTYHSDQSQSPTYTTDQRQTPTYPTDQRQTPTYPTEQRQTPTYPTDQRQTPTYPTDQSQTPTYHSDQRQTPTYHNDQRQTPTYPTDQRQTPTYPSDQRQTPTYHSDQRQTPTYPTDQRQTPTYPTDQRHGQMYPVEPRTTSLTDQRFMGSQPTYPGHPMRQQDQYRGLGQEELSNPSLHQSLPSDRRPESADQMTLNDINFADDAVREAVGSAPQYGFTQKEKAKLKTVRDVKKNEIERRRREGFESLDNHPLRRSSSLPGSSGRSLPSPIGQQGGNYNSFDRQSTPRASATSRLFPQGPQPSQNLKSPERIRRMSDIYTPRPFISPASDKKVSPLAVRNPVRGDEMGQAAAPSYEWFPTAVPKVGPRGRAMTISSSRPIRMEQATPKAVRSHSVAGDLISMRPHHDIDIVRSKTAEDLDYDDTTIEREVLFVPEKVFIPERYIPDSEEEVSDSEMFRRQEKAVKIRKMLAAHSLQEFGQNEIDYGRGDTHSEVEKEKKRREHILDLKGALAKQAISRSKEVAEMQMLSMTDGYRYLEEDPSAFT